MSTRTLTIHSRSFQNYVQSMATFVEEHAAIKFNLPSLEQYIREDEYDEYSATEEDDDNVADAMPDTFWHSRHNGYSRSHKVDSGSRTAALKEQKFENYFGRKIAVDASMHIYSFLVAVGRTGDQLLTNETGDVTSHILGMFFRTTRMLEAGIKPIFVFEGKAPDLKKEELAKRSARREGANAELEAAKEAGDKEGIEKFSKRTIRVTREHNEDCKKLLRLMGIPVIDAPSEAEAQCAQLCKEGHVYGISTEDMDSLTLGTPKLLRHLMAPAAQKVSVLEFDHDMILKELDLTNDEFIDLCILCGCDYTSKIQGIGPVRALQLIRKHKCIERILEELDPNKYKIPQDFPYKEARELFKSPDVLKQSGFTSQMENS
eukprot:jgi/Picre1/32334/NNA_007680.t1